MTTLQTIIASDFDELFNAEHIDTSGSFITVKDPVTGVESLFEYRITRATPDAPAELHICSPDTSWERYQKFLRRRLNFASIAARQKVVLDALLQGIEYVTPELTQPSDVQPQPEGGVSDTSLESILSGAAAPELVFIGADGGRGKSTLLRHYARASNERAAKDVLYLYINIHGKSFASLFEHVAFELDRVAPWISYRGLLRLVAHGLVRLVIDGFDELGVELGEDVVFQRLNELVDEIQTIREGYETEFLTHDRLVLLLSGRTQYFSNAGLRDRIARLAAGTATWVEFLPWEPARAVEYVQKNRSEGPLDGPRSGRLLDALETIKSTQSDIYPIVVHPVVLRLLSDAEVDLLANAAGAPPSGRFAGLVAMLGRGVEQLLAREESKQITPSGDSDFPIPLQHALIENLCTELLRANEDPLRFDPIYVELAANAVAVEHKLGSESARRFAAVALQHQLWGMRSKLTSKQLGFLHQSVFDVVSGWTIFERLRRADGRLEKIVPLLDVKHLSDECLASAAIRLQETPELARRVADAMQMATNARKLDGTTQWNLTKICLDRSLIGGEPAIPSTGRWELSNARFVQLTLPISSLSNAVITDSEFHLCEIHLPTARSEFRTCRFVQCTLFAEAASNAAFDANCQLLYVSVEAPGTRLGPFFSIDELVGESSEVVGGITSLAPTRPQPKLTSQQRSLLRLAREGARLGYFSIENLLAVYKVDEKLARDFIYALKKEGYVTERPVHSHSGNERRYQVRGDIAAGAYELFAQGRFA